MTESKNETPDFDPHQIGFEALAQYLFENHVPIFGPQTGIELVRICDGIGKAIENPPDNAIVTSYLKVYFHALRTLIQVSIIQQGLVIGVLGAFVDNAKTQEVKPLSIVPSQETPAYPQNITLFPEPSDIASVLRVIVRGRDLYFTLSATVSPETPVPVLNMFIDTVYKAMSVQVSQGAFQGKDLFANNKRIYSACAWLTLPEWMDPDEALRDMSEHGKTLRLRLQKKSKRTGGSS